MTPSAKFAQELGIGFYLLFELDGFYWFVRRQKPKEHIVRGPKPVALGEPNDADVVRRAQRGDADAFERIYRLHSRRVYALCLRMAGNPTEAEDLTQDVFLQLFRKIDTFRGESAFSTWLHRMSVNIVLMRFRRKPLAETSLDSGSNPEDEGARGPKDFGGPDLCLNGVIDGIVLQAAINELSPGYRAMFVLHYIQGYKHREIAEILGCSAGNSKSQAHKARMQLRELLRNRLSATEHQHRRSLADPLAVEHPEFAVDSACG